MVIAMGRVIMNKKWSLQLITTAMHDGMHNAPADHATVLFQELQESVDIFWHTDARYSKTFSYLNPGV